MKLNPTQPLLAALVTGLLAWAAMLPARADYSSRVMSLNPVAYWRLSEPAELPVNYAIGTATNIGSAGAAGSATYYHSPTLQTNGAVAGDPAAHLNGTSQYAEVPYSPALNPTNLTVEFWAKLDIAVTAAKSGVVSRFIGGGRQTGYLFFTHNGNNKWQFRVYNGTGAVTITDTLGPDIDPDVWYHVTGVYDGAQAHIYVNGVEATPPVNAAYAVNTNTPLRIGAGTTEGPATLFFPGTIDEVAVFPTVLSASTIAAHYNAAATNAAGYAAQILASNPSGYWRLNEPILPPEPVPTPHTTTNLGGWRANANGVWYAGDMNLGTPGVPYHGFGSNNTAGLFNGAGSSFIEIPLQNVPPVAGLTITCWAKRNGLLDPWSMIYSHPNDLGLPVATESHPVTGIGFGDSAGRNDHRGYYKGDIANTGNFGWTPSPTLLMPDQQWTFMALVVDAATNMVIYENGNSRTRNFVHGTHDFSTCASFIGKKQKYFGFGGGEVNGFKGTIDEVAIYDKALTRAQILQILDAAEVPPIILTQPQVPAPPVYEGTTLSLSVEADVASSTTPLAYQWTRNGLPLSGQTGTNYTVGSLVTNDNGSYAVVITNNYGAVTSSIIVLTVQAGPPVFLLKPQPIQRFAGGTATFTSVVVGSSPLSYQWSFNNTPISAATSSTYTIHQVGTAEVGNYSVVVTNPYGNTNSGNAALTLLPVTPYAAEVMASGPVGYWRFNEASGATAFDYSGGLHGTNVSVGYGTAGPRPTSAPTAFVGFESTNTPYSFSNASASEVRLPTSFAINRGAFSIVSWIRADTATPYLNIMAQGGNTWRFHLGSDASTLEFITAGLSGSGGNTLNGATIVVDGSWHQAVAVYDGTATYIYVDGVQDGTLVNKTGLETVDSSLVTIGSQSGGLASSSWRWNGEIDEVAVYDRGLSAAEVANLYRQATSAPGLPQILLQPVSQTVFIGQPASFSVTVEGGAPYSYQWKHAGTNLPGATKSTLTIPSTYYTDAGTYSVGITNGAGGTNSQVANLTVLPQPLFANLTNDLVLHLKFDGTHLDSSGRTNDGTAVGVPTFVAGKIGSNAVHVDSEADLTVPASPVCTNANYVTLGTPADLQFGTDTDFTVAYWVKMPAGEKYTEFPVLCDSSGGTFSPGLYFGTTWNQDDRAGGFTWWLGGVGRVFESPANTINDGNWHHLVFSFDRLKNGVSYLDGVLVDSRPINNGGNVDVPGQTMNIGQDTTGTYPWFGIAGPKAECVIDDMGIWRRALSPTEAQSVYIVGQNYGRSFDTYGPVQITLRRTSTGLELIWQAGTLESADSLQGAWTPVAGATAPYHALTPTADRKFYRVKL